MPRNSKCAELVGLVEKKLFGLTENTMLPPEQTLADEFGVSKPTLRRALQELADTGKIRKINGVGIMVIRPPRTISRELIFICHDIVFFSEGLKSFGTRAAELNYFISIIPLAGDARTQERILLSAAERQPAGMVIYADPRQQRLAAFHQLAASRSPTLYLMRLPQGVDSNLLEFGNADGMVEIVEAFYAGGCRRIALYGNHFVNPGAAVEREQGYRTAMTKCRLKPRPEFCCLPGSTPERHEAFLQLFRDQKSSPDAVCCLNDQCAGKLILELQQRGIDIGCIRFSGYDHAPLCDFLPQPILTVEPPMTELGLVAAEMVIRQVENPQFGFQRRKLRATVINTGENRRS